MSVTRRGFLGIGAAILGGAMLPGKDPTPLVPDEYGALLTKLEKEGLKNGPRKWQKLGKVFAEEIQATMERPGFCDRLFQDHYAPIEKEELLRSGKVGVLGDFQIVQPTAAEIAEFGMESV